MAPDNDLVTSLMKETNKILSSETIVIEALDELVKEEIKKSIMEKLEANPELKAELKSAVKELMEAKIHEAYAVLKIGKVSAKIGIEMVPPNMRKEIGRELASMFEKEISRMLEQS